MVLSGHPKAPATNARKGNRRGGKRKTTTTTTATTTATATANPPSPNTGQTSEPYVVRPRGAVGGDDLAAVAVVALGQLDAQLVVKPLEEEPRLVRAVEEEEHQHLPSEKGWQQWCQERGEKGGGRRGSMPVEPHLERARQADWPSVIDSTTDNIDKQTSQVNKR